MAVAQPAGPSKQSAQTAAKASWIAVLVPIGVRFAMQSSTREAGPNAWMVATLSVVLTVVCCLIGIGAGAYALAKVRSVGREGVLTPALIGTVLNGLILAIMVFAFVAAVGRR